VISPKNVYEELKSLGLTRAQARKLLPDWWSPEMEASPDGVAELCLLLSRRLNLDYGKLANGVVVGRNLDAPVAFKHSTAQDPSSLRASTGIARALAQAVLAAAKGPQKPLPQTPAAWAKLAKDHGNGVVGLASLIDACWSIGVPVIPMTGLPVGIKKMDGAVLATDRGYAIIVSKKKSSRAWLAFILSHEIGHLAKGHLGKDGSIIDVALQEQSTYATDSGADVQEREADEFALALMGGSHVAREIAVWSPRSSPVQLAVLARKGSVVCGVEPGHLILRFAFQTQRWTESIAALNYLREDANADEVMKAALKRHLDLDLIADDMSEFVRQTIGMD
jgi:hypothetical protein